MTARNDRLWRSNTGVPAPRGGAGKLGTRPGAAMMGTDAESGDAGTGSGQAQALHALTAMFDRGLIDRATFDARKSEIEAGRVNPEDF